MFLVVSSLEELCVFVVVECLKFQLFFVHQRRFAHLMLVLLLFRFYLKEGSEIPDQAPLKVI